MPRARTARPHLFGPRLTSETILDYGNRMFHMTQSGAGYEPNEPHFEAQQNFTWVHGKRSVKFGGGFEPI